MPTAQVAVPSMHVCTSVGMRGEVGHNQHVRSWMDGVARLRTSSGCGLQWTGVSVSMRRSVVDGMYDSHGYAQESWARRAMAQPLEHWPVEMKCIR